MAQAMKQNICFTWQVSYHFAAIGVPPARPSHDYSLENDTLCLLQSACPQAGLNIWQEQNHPTLFGRYIPWQSIPLALPEKNTHTKTWSDLTCFFENGSGGYSFSVWDLYKFFTCRSVGGVKLPGASSYKSPIRFPWIPSLSLFEFTVDASSFFRRA